MSFTTDFKVFFLELFSPLGLRDISGQVWMVCSTKQIHGKQYHLLHSCAINDCNIQLFHHTISHCYSYPSSFTLFFFSCQPDTFCLILVLLGYSTVSSGSLFISLEFTAEKLFSDQLFNKIFNYSQTCLNRTLSKP